MSVRILEVVSVSVSILHVVSVCPSAYYRLFPYFCQHITGCSSMSIRILQVVSVCLRITDSLLSVGTKLFPPLCLAAYYRLQSHLSGPYGLSCISAYFRLCRLVRALIASVIVTSVTHTGPQLIPDLYKTLCHFV
jgi:hypothetical protein